MANTEALSLILAVPLVAILGLAFASRQRMKKLEAKARALETESARENVDADPDSVPGPVITEMAAGLIRVRASALPRRPSTPPYRAGNASPTRRRAPQG